MARVRDSRVSLEDVLRSFPNANKDPESWEDVLAALKAAGIQLAEQAEADAGVEVEVDIEGEEEYQTASLGSAGADPLALYLREMGLTPLLTAEQEMKLARDVTRGEALKAELDNGNLTLERKRQLRADLLVSDMARETLIKANQRLVISVAKRYRGLGVPFLDLIQEGNLGLMRSIERFDPAKGNRLSTYAMWWIRQSIIRAVANLSRTIRVPIHAGERERKLRKVAQELQQTLGRTPNAHELAAELGLTPRQVQRLQNMGQQAVSLDQPIREGESDGSSLADLIEDENSLAPSELAAQRLLRDDVAAVLADLKPREAEVLRLRYGLDGERVHTLKEVGVLMGVTRERVRQLEMRALRKLRHPRIGRRLKGYQRRR
ncbi:MAG: sigma-70 family RNA polymerase sigma factor [Anaerolineae bacterium]|uniref:sigma-70 family RNA polymerase sigma factor n=1 Tax=Candidatus Amarolinea dominans TaxID=3140696 RepID=UPI001DC3FBD5|nr:sigma-70 family RNA polymerase sigma factor [Anaerolineae bacterium]MBK7201732.1 sigma-70 family RNA polymerase sigma factor [Anaerolineae bacterium]MBK9096183.1 sigma-70 family RNA polymerase sigma factor [Anaerolineae bacterium]MBK9230985.1 sigma-70 family RNA polymerase sigma factor [Anaerolineae bacterium]